MSSPLPRWRLHRLHGHLLEGGLIAYPTEGVYGLGCDPWNRAAVTRLLRVKGRSPNLGLILIASEFQQLSPFLDPLPEERMKQVLWSWPGPVTWLLPASPECPWWIRGNHPGVAVRVTAHPIAATLCRTFAGPLVSTSANPTNSPPALTQLQVRRYFQRVRNLMIVPGPLGSHKGATPIFDALSGRCLRA